jgi:pyruvate/2-oxoglutarate dehydrogenase complex dihydrolipoamide acyltransferase (E2) component
MAVDVVLPEAEEGAEIEVLEVYVEVGETVAAGDLLVEIATDKANVQVPAPAGGVVAEILVADGDVLPSGAVLMRIADA